MAQRFTAPSSWSISRATSPTHWLATRARWALWVGIVALAAACGGPIEVRREMPLADDAPLPKGIVVLPVAEMTHKSDAIEVAIRTSAVAGWLVDQTELAIVGPFDFKTLKELDEVQVASTDTDLVTRGDAEGVDIRGWWSMHILLTENRAASNRRIVDTNKGQAEGGKTLSNVYGVESELRLEVTLRDAMRGTLLAVVVIVATDDPNDMPLEGEPRPLVPRMVDDALRRLFGDSLERLQANQARKVRTSGLLVSAPALADQEFPSRASFSSTIGGKSEDDRDAAMFAIWDRIHPKLAIGAAVTATRSPGVMLTKARAPLQVHDVITEIDGHPVRDVYQLDRRLRVCGGGCRGKIARGRDVLELPLPWSSLPRPQAD